jgi:hypothetical protein
MILFEGTTLKNEYHQNDGSFESKKYCSSAPQIDIQIVTELIWKTRRLVAFQAALELLKERYHIVDEVYAK